MEHLSQQRRDIAKRVMRAMRYDTARAALAEAVPEGAQKVVICLRDDTVEYAAAMVLDAGGVATVVVPAGDQPGLVPLQWRLGQVQQAALDVESGIHPESTVGMLADYMSMRQDRVNFVFRIAVSSGEAVITEREPFTVPA